MSSEAYASFGTERSKADAGRGDCSSQRRSHLILAIGAWCWGKAARGFCSTGRNRGCGQTWSAVDVTRRSDSKQVTEARPKALGSARMKEDCR